MKIEDAIQTLKGSRDCAKEHGFDVDDYDLAISALNNQLPKKVIVISSLETYCPCCDNELINNYYYFSYCEKCGQKIDWSEADNE